jgi:transcriptional regulator with XRE-family HTH domain
LTQNTKEISEFIVKLRESKNWSQREAAHALGISNSLLSQVENGTTELSSRLQASISDVFGCPKDWIERIHDLKIETVEEEILRLEENTKKLVQIRDILLHSLDEMGRRAIFIIGDLCMDDIDIQLFSGGVLEGSRSETASPIVGGKGLNSAMAFESRGYIPVIFGGVGKDYYGKKIIDSIKDVHHIISLIKIYEGKQTGETTVSFGKVNRTNKYKHAIDKADDANDFSFSVEYLREMITVSGINKDWFIYFIGTIFQRYKLRHIKFEELEKERNSEENPFEFYRRDFATFVRDLIDALYKTGAPIIIRVPQELEHLNLNEFNLLSRHADFLTGEYLSFVEIFKDENDKPDGKYNIREEKKDEEIIENIQHIVERIDGQTGQYFMFFYGGFGNIDNFIFGKRTENRTLEILEGPRETGYAKLKEKNPADKPEDFAKKRIGFIDRYIAKFIWDHDSRNKNAEKNWKWEWPKREG